MLPAMTNELTPGEDTTAPQPAAPPEPAPAAPNGWRTFGIVVITVVLTLGIGYWAFTSYLFPIAFKPVYLNDREQQHLDEKIERLSGDRPAPATGKPPQAEPYRETGASREIYFSEKELNALLANNTDLASKLAIDLSDNLASAKLLLPLDPEFPILGGKTLKVTAGMELDLVDGTPRAVLKGVSVWGVPLPNAWLGNMKNTDLIAEFGEAGGFWQAMKEGVDEIEVREGKLRIRLKE
jgi:hypothetical protein